MPSGHKVFTIVESGPKHLAIVEGLKMKQIVLNASRLLGFWDCSLKSQTPSGC
jgi:hypothetical protein